MSRAVVAFADNNVQVGLALLTSISDALLQNLFRLFHILTMEIDRVCCDLANGIVLAEDELGCLFVVSVSLRSMLLALLAQAVRLSTIASRVGLLRLCSKVLALTLLLTSEISKAIVLALCVGGRTVVESCKSVSWRNVDSVALTMAAKTV